MESFFLTGLALHKKVRANELAECVNLTEIMDSKQEIRDFSYGTSPGENLRVSGMCKVKLLAIYCFTPRAIFPPPPTRAEYRPLKPHRDISRYGKCISQCVLNISYKQESQFSISYRSQNLLH